MDPTTTPALYYIDTDTTIGVLDTTNGETKLDPNAATTDHVNLTNAGYAALTNAYLGPHDTWALTDGTLDPTFPLAEDTAPNAINPYVNHPTDTTGQNPALLAGTTTWTTDATHGEALTLDGTTGYAATTGAALTTTNSFTVSAWVKLTTTPTRNATIAGQDGTTTSGFFLQYNYTHANAPGWALNIPTSDGSSFATAYAAGATTAWTHLVGVYNATTHTAQLYVNGTLTGTATNVTTSDATGPFTIGRGLFNATPTDFLPGTISNVQAWQYALTPTQITALYQQIS
ncbi:LamG domain-containing protein [Rugosimonospora africana]|uniref:LamG-like jellyroll fold domain-containing protein n=1 Tax=Rugosimonospora africana TaxID=556532 RepID=A0A8J3VUK0_9ACTN|nr:LamG domain-containing protein [Rugosimonospora africana]GIH18984.1 hypothetical protein Raf01_71560 [Rugosimonospora africana]